MDFDLTGSGFYLLYDNKSLAEHSPPCASQIIYLFVYLAVSLYIFHAAQLYNSQSSDLEATLSDKTLLYARANKKHFALIFYFP